MYNFLNSVCDCFTLTNIDYVFSEKIAIIISRKGSLVRTKTKSVYYFSYFFI
jgi:hypothetical protein